MNILVINRLQKSIYKLVNYINRLQELRLQELILNRKMNWFIIIFFLIAIGLFALSHYLRLKKEIERDNIEHFQTEVNLTIIEKLAKYHNIKQLNFKNASEASKLINKNAEYLKKMNQPNLSARGCNSQDELYNKYLDAFDDINDKERKVVNKFILELLEKIKPRNLAYYNYLCNWLSRISFAKAKPWLEAGMPHTLEDTIIMDAGWFINPRETTLVHELTHVHQRIVPFEFEEVYKDLGYLEYTPGVENIKGMGVVVALNRNNPDGLSANWLWLDNNNNHNVKTYWWIGAVFNNITPSSLTDVNNVGLKLERDSDGTYYYLKQQPILLNSLVVFNKFFGMNDSANNYHPNEMSAKFGEWFLEYVLGNANGENYNCDGFKIYKKHFEKLTNTFYSK